MRKKRPELRTKQAPEYQPKIGSPKQVPKILKGGESEKKYMQDDETYFH